MLFVKYDAEAARRVRDKEVAEEADQQATTRERRKTLDAIKKSIKNITNLDAFFSNFNLTPEEKAYVTSDKT